MRNDAAVFLRDAGHETGHVFKRHERNVEAIAEAHEPPAFNRSSDVQHAREKRRLIRHDTDSASAETREADADVRRKEFLYFKEVTIIDDVIDDFAHVVRLV